MRVSTLLIWLNQSEHFVVLVHTLSHFNRHILTPQSIVHRLVFDLQRLDLLLKVGRVTEKAHAVPHTSRIPEG
jgi:hypothetical protein